MGFASPALGRAAPELTVVLLTRNRPQQAIAQLRLFKKIELPYPVVIVDSSDPAQAAIVRSAAAEGVTYRYLAPEIGLYQKLAGVSDLVDTPFVLTVPDKKITFPHSIDPLLAHLRRHADYVAAAGYVLRFEEYEQDIDIFRVFFFTPSVDEDAPMQRHYHLMRRYQPSAFAVLRTKALAAAALQAVPIAGSIFKEIMLMNALALQGKIARLPVILSLHGAESSRLPLTERDPLHWFLHDAGSFFRHYVAYREALATHIRAEAVPCPDGVDLTRLLDMIHSTWLGRSCDTGAFNHVARMLLGEAMPPLGVPGDWLGPSAPKAGDVVHIAGAGQRRYLWRRSGLGAEPRSEITITDAEIRRVERALDIFFAE